MFSHLFKIRCSAINKIMAPMKGGSITDRQAKIVADYEGRESLTGPQQKELDSYIAKRDATPELPQGAKTYAETWLAEQVYQRRKKFSSKQTKKGNLTEDEVIKLIGEYINEPYLEKYTGPNMNGEYITGDPDVIYTAIDSMLKAKRMVIDAKSCTDPFTFPLLDCELDPIYRDQIEGYKILYKCDGMMVGKGLVNLPEEMVLREAGFIARERGVGIDEVYDDVKAFYTYDNLPIEARVRMFEVEPRPWFEAEVIKRVKMIREYISGLEQQDKMKKIIAEFRERAAEQPTQLTALQGAQKKVA